MTDTIDVAALVERLLDESRSLSWRSLEHGSADAGIASNLADEAATALQSQADALAEARRELKDRDKVFCAMLSTGVCDLPDRLATAEASLATMREALEEIEQSWLAATSGNKTDVARITGWQGALDNMGQIFAWVARRALGGSNAE